MLERDGDEGQKWTCSFCGRHARHVEGLTSNSDESAAICTSCVEGLHRSLTEGRGRSGYQPGWMEVVEHLGHSTVPLHAPDHEEKAARGVVKFFRESKGWGGIESDETPGDVWVHFSAIDTAGWRHLEAGDQVEFRYVRRNQDSWRFVATWVRRLPSG